jgi:hypothetical protein
VVRIVVACLALVACEGAGGALGTANLTLDGSTIANTAWIQPIARSGDYGGWSVFFAAVGGGRDCSDAAPAAVAALDLELAVPTVDPSPAVVATYELGACDAGSACGSLELLMLGIAATGSASITSADLTEITGSLTAVGEDADAPSLTGTFAAERCYD